MILLVTNREKQQIAYVLDSCGQMNQLVFCLILFLSLCQSILSNKNTNIAYNIPDPG